MLKAIIITGPSATERREAANELTSGKIVLWINEHEFLSENYRFDKLTREIQIICVEAQNLQPESIKSYLTNDLLHVNRKGERPFFVERPFLIVSQPHIDTRQTLDHRPDINIVRTPIYS